MKTKTLPWCHFLFLSLAKIPKVSVHCTDEATEKQVLSSIADGNAKSIMPMENILARSNRTTYVLTIQSGNLALKNLT